MFYTVCIGSIYGLRLEKLAVNCIGIRILGCA